DPAVRPSAGRHRRARAARRRAALVLRRVPAGARPLPGTQDRARRARRRLCLRARVAAALRALDGGPRISVSRQARDPRVPDRDLGGAGHQEVRRLRLCRPARARRRARAVPRARRLLLRRVGRDARAARDAHAGAAGGAAALEWLAAPVAPRRRGSAGRGDRRRLRPRGAVRAAERGRQAAPPQRRRRPRRDPARAARLGGAGLTVESRRGWPVPEVARPKGRANWYQLARSLDRATPRERLRRALRARAAAAALLAN